MAASRHLSAKDLRVLWRRASLSDLSLAHSTVNIAISITNWTPMLRIICRQLPCFWMQFTTLGRFRPRIFPHDTPFTLSSQMTSLCQLLSRLRSLIADLKIFRCRICHLDLQIRHLV
jgi:hypothetical protein